MLIRRVPLAILPFPFDYLGKTTLVQYKGPDDTADQSALVKLVIDALMVQRREGQWMRSDYTSWVIASSFGRNLSMTGGAEILIQDSPGPDVRRGMVDGFPICLVDLNDVPVTADTLPLSMYRKAGRRSGW